MLRRFATRAANRFRHPIHVVSLYQARCECGWVGPVREWSIDADDDRTVHWRCTGS